MNIPIEKIKKIRSIIHDKFVSNYTTITSISINYLFSLYDEFFFNNAIKKKLKDDNKTLKFIILTKKYGDVMTSGFNKYYFLEISPKVLSKLADQLDMDKISCCQISIEHEIIHIIMIMWGYYDKHGSIYEYHGKLFQCMLDKYFKHSVYKHNFGVENDKMGYSYKSNSCYIDSLLTILFFSDCNMKDILLLSDVSGINYTNIKCPNIKDLKSQAILIREELQKDYDSLLLGYTTYCTNTRKLLTHCLPDMVKYGSWTFYNVGAIYSMLTDLFPSMKMHIAQRVMKWMPQSKTYKEEPITHVNEALVTMWDFMDPLISYKDQDYKKILWDQIDSPYLVFYNGGIPRIRKLNSLENEKKITKARCFDEFILDNRYEICGVVTLLGVVQSGKGVHYISYYKMDGKYYKYDDIGAIIEKIDNFPINGVWQEREGKMPSMYFYKKV